MTHTFLNKDSVVIQYIHSLY